MTLQQMRQIITIADVGSMNEAAKQLYVSQPNLSAVVRDVESEAGITIFLRSNRGIKTTPEGEEFISYARQVMEQYSLLEKRYMEKDEKEKFSVSCQHYSFAVAAFVDLVREVGMNDYEFAIHETTTYQVIKNVHDFRSEIGILYLSDFNRTVLSNMIRENNLEFTALLECDTYVYLWKGHPLADRKVITMSELADYPCLAFEQGSHSSFYLAEEMKSTYSYRRLIRVDDRATMLNLMVGLMGYTLCSGIIIEELNGTDYRAVPLAETEKMTIGCLRHKGMKLSRLGQIYLDKLAQAGGQKK